MQMRISLSLLQHHIPRPLRLPRKSNEDKEKQYRENNCATIPIGEYPLYTFISGVLAAKIASVLLRINIIDVSQLPTPSSTIKHNIHTLFERVDITFALSF